MEKIAILTDSGCDLPNDILKEYDIKLLPFRIIYKDREFLDIIEISPDEVYDNLDKEIPTTSLPDLQYMENVLNELENEGYTHVIAVTISNALSGTYNSLRIMLENHPKLTSFIFDTKTLSRPQGETALTVAKMLKEGSTFDEITKALPEIQSHLAGYFTINTLEYLKKGGRIGKVAGTIGELLNIKPLIAVGEDGSYYTYAKARGRKQAISKLKQLVEDSTSQGKCRIWVLDGGANDEAQKLCEYFTTQNNVVDCSISKIGPALGVHTGPGLLGITIQTGL